MICPFCKCSELNKLFTIDKRVYGGIFSVMRCEKCNLAWTAPLPPESEIAQYYPDEYHGSTGKQRFIPLLERLVKGSRKKRAKEVSELFSHRPGKVLDIGAGRAWMLSVLKSWGWDVCGTELSLKSSTFARERLNLEIYTKELHQCAFPSCNFDVVTMWHVLEHLHDPLSALNEVNRILKDGGYLIVEVPNFGGFQASLFRNKWFHLDAPRHLYHFGHETLKKYLEDCGFEVVKSKNFSWEYDLFGFIQSTLNFVCYKFDYLYNFLRSREGKMIKGNPLKYIWDFIVSLTAFPLLLLLSLPLASLSSMFGRGGTLKLYCRKERQS